MKKDLNKINGILNELISNAIDASAKNIKTTVEDTGDEIIITVIDDGKGMCKEKQDEVIKMLNMPRHIEMEEYYGELTGQSRRHSGLIMISIMIDRAEVYSEPGKGTTIRVFRKKNGGHVPFVLI